LGVAVKMSAPKTVGTEAASASRLRPRMDSQLASEE
jgi:hypothetical protein